MKEVTVFESEAGSLHKNKDECVEDDLRYFKRNLIEAINIIPRDVEKYLSEIQNRFKQLKDCIITTKKTKPDVFV